MKGESDMAEFTVRSISPEEYTNNLRKEIEQDGLFKAVKKRCDEIDEECKYMRYVQHRTVQELLSEILELIKMR